MDRRERAGDPNEMMLAALEGHQSQMWTALPGFIVSFNAAKQTCTVQPTLKCQFEQQDGSFQWVQMPVIQDIPVFFPKGGGATLTFPIAANDECLLVFASRCIDSWWQSGGIQVQADKRMHDLSDAMAFVGFSSVPQVIGSISTTAAQLRSNDGNAVVSLNPSTHEVDVVTSGVLNIQASQINITGPITLTGSLTASGDVKAEGHSLATHLHTGVTPGASNTGGPT